MSNVDARPGDPSPDAPQFAARGPYSVGTRRIEAVHKDQLDVLALAQKANPRYDRPVHFDLFYPCVAGTGTPAAYNDVLSSNAGLPKLPISLSGYARRDATIDGTLAALPLIVVTHGYPGSAAAMTWLTESLASRGYVVVGLDVTDSTHSDVGPRTITLLHRPLDILFVISELERLAASPGSELTKLIDFERIGLVGYSMGGYASLNVAGVGFKQEFVNWDTSVPRQKLAVRATGNAEYQSTLDSRIRAIAAISPWGAGVAFDAPDLLGLSIPSIFFAGDRDDVAGFAPGVRQLYDWAEHSERSLVVFEGAGHSIGLNPPPAEARSSARPGDFAHYADALWDSWHVNDVIRHFVTAFMGRHLSGDLKMATYLDLAERGGPSVGSINAENIEGAPRTWAGFNEPQTRGLSFHRRKPVPMLPQADTHSVAREEARRVQQGLYRYDHETYAPLAMAAQVPSNDQFPAAWFGVNLGVVGALLENAAHAARVRNPTQVISPAIWDAVNKIKSGNAGSDLFKVLGLAQQGLEDLRIRGNATSLAEYSALFQTIPAPPLVYLSLDDATFAQNFLSGANPMMLRLLAVKDSARMSLSDVAVERALGKGATVVDALRERRLFVADYAMLQNAECGLVGGRQKYLPAPIAYFGVSKRGELVPVAIQLAEGLAAPLLTPADGASWLVARTAVMTADANASAVYFHHAKTHMVIEPIVVSISRQLAPNHPIRVLLAPHFIGTLAINRTGQVTVFAPGGLIEKVGAATRPTFRTVSVHAVQSQSVRALNLRGSLAERGVADSALLPNFAFREDALLLWDALAAWIGDYVGLYYGSDADVAKDAELRAFLAEVESQDGGRLKDVGPLDSRANLVELLTIVIFTASAQHWALNGPLATWMTFAPNYPLALWGEPRPAQTAADWLALLPPLEMAQQQLEAAYGMGSTRYNILGQYDSDTFADPRVRAPLEEFRERLVSIERQILARNAKRTNPYTMLLPSQLPASINI